MSLLGEARPPPGFAPFLGGGEGQRINNQSVETQRNGVVRFREYVGWFWATPDDSL